MSKQSAVLEIFNEVRDKAGNCRTHKNVEELISFLEFIADSHPFGDAKSKEDKERAQRNFVRLMIKMVEASSNLLRPILIKSFGANCVRLRDGGDIQMNPIESFLDILRYNSNGPNPTEASKIKLELLRLHSKPYDSQFGYHLSLFNELISRHDRISPSKLSDDEKKKYLINFIGKESYSSCLFSLAAAGREISAENIMKCLMVFTMEDFSMSDPLVKEERPHHGPQTKLPGPTKRPSDGQGFVVQKRTAPIPQQNNKLCSHCGRGNHTSEQCKFKHIECNICKGKHFYSICPKNTEKRVPEKRKDLSHLAYGLCAEVEFSPPTPIPGEIDPPEDFEDFSLPESAILCPEVKDPRSPPATEVNESTPSLISFSKPDVNLSSSPSSISSKNIDSTSAYVSKISKGSSRIKGKGNTNVCMMAKGISRMNRIDFCGTENNSKEGLVGIKLVADTGCTRTMFGKDVRPYLVNIQRVNATYVTANGQILCRDSGILKGTATAIDGSTIPVEIIGCINDSLSKSLLSTEEICTSKDNAWVVVEGTKQRLKLQSVGSMHYLVINVPTKNKPAKYSIMESAPSSENNSYNSSVEEMDSDKRYKQLLELLGQCGYIKYSALGEKMTKEEVLRSLYPFIRHMHIRLAHPSIEIMKNTFREQGLHLSRSQIEGALFGCKVCIAKKNHINKVPKVAHRVKPRINQEATFSAEQVRNNYVGTGVYPNHCIIQDVTYMPVMGIDGATGVSVIVDLKTSYVSVYVIYGKTNDKSLTLETTQHLTQWCTSKGIPSIVKTDNGPEFNGLYHEYCKSNAICHQYGAPYCPFQQGSVERANGILKKLIGILLKEKNWPEDHWNMVAGSAKEIHNLCATSIGASPHSAWYGSPPSLRLIPLDRAVVNVSYYPSIREEEPQQFGKTVACTYLYRDGSIARLALHTAKRGIATFFVPLRNLGVHWISIRDAAIEGANIFKEPRNIDDVMQVLNNQVKRNRYELEKLVWDPISEIADVSKAPTNRSRNGLQSTATIEDKMIEVESFARKRRAVELDGNSPQIHVVEDKPRTSREAKSTEVVVSKSRSIQEALSKLKDKLRVQMALYKEGFQYDQEVACMVAVQGKTHEDVSLQDIRNGTHDSSMSVELSQFISNKVVGQEIARDEAKRQGYTIIPSRWVHSWKLLSNNDGRKAKSRLVLRGFMDREKVPVYIEMPNGSLRRLTSIIGLGYGKDAHIADVRTAFLQAPLPEGRRIAAVFPTVLPPGELSKGFKPGGVYPLSKAMYGLQDSPRAFCNWLKVKLEQLKWKCVGWGCYVRPTTTTVDIIVAYMDDLWIWSNHVSKIMEEIKDHVSMDDPKPITNEWIRYIGVDVKRDCQTVKISVKSYIEGLEVPNGVKGFIRDSEFPITPASEEEVDESLSKEMSTLVGKLGWIASNHLGLSYLYGELSRHVSKPCTRILDIARRVIASIKCATPFDLCFVAVRNEGELRVWTDASLRRTGLSGTGRNGYIIQYVEKDTPIKSTDNFVSWGSSVDKRKHPSTSSAELSALLIGLREAVELVKIINALTRKKVSLNAYVDAQVVQTQITNRRVNKNPFDQENLDYVMQCLTDLESLGVHPAPEIRHVDTKTQKADCLTKYIRGVWTSSNVFGMLSIRN